NSRLAIFLGLLIALSIRAGYFTNNERNGYNATTWDALGYYMYLPGMFIYDDVKELKWFPKVDSTYQVSGGQFYQASQLENGDYAFKYLGGVAIMEAPFFFIGHAIAYANDAPEDGFSWPYQYAIIFGAVFWYFVGLIYSRKVLLRYYSESITSLTLFAVILGTNLLQYVSVDGAMSHAFIFPLYALILWFTIRWHETPKMGYALAIGLLSGLAIISRPTELIIIFIPLLWSLESSGKLKSKWALVKTQKLHLVAAAFGGILGILPQLLYWKHATGSFIYDVGSKWYFLNPWWRVLVGFEKGWFIYTPMAIFMVAGLFFMKGKPFRKAVLTFCLLNIWIIISWSDWRYGASYSTRALTQSYPVFMLGLAAIFERIGETKWRYIVLPLGIYLTAVNLFQIWQYNKTILHFDHMNFAYYKAIYLDKDPTPLDYSLLDDGIEILKNLRTVNTHEVFLTDSILPAGRCHVQTISSLTSNFMNVKIDLRTRKSVHGAWCFFTLYSKGKSVLKKIRLGVPGYDSNREMHYESNFDITNADSVVCSFENYEATSIQNMRFTISELK
ncbi:MAG: hypothetical protein ACOVO3_04485, partial [Fluviicola sp.]